MTIDTEKREDVLYRADPLTFIFRELDLMHGEIREIKTDIKTDFANINKRLDDVNKRLDSMNDSINKRFDNLYLIVILNLVGIVAFLIKGFFF